MLYPRSSRPERLEVTGSTAVDQVTEPFPSCAIPLTHPRQGHYFKIRIQLGNGSRSREDQMYGWMSQAITVAIRRTGWITAPVRS